MTSEVRDSLSFRFPCVGDGVYDLGSGVDCLGADAVELVSAIQLRNLCEEFPKRIRETLLRAGRISE